MENPQAEVYWAGEELTPCHHNALVHSALLYARP